jgi:hypothetical protein
MARKRRAKADVGRCYEEAYRLAQELGADLVHGFPRLTGGPFVGRLFGHAWTELNGRVMVILDNSPAIVSRESYYAMGQIDEALCLRYSTEEARAAVVEHKHFGPWVIPEGLPEEPLFGGQQRRRAN